MYWLSVLYVCGSSVVASYDWGMPVEPWIKPGQGKGVDDEVSNDGEPNCKIAE